MALNEEAARLYRDRGSREASCMPWITWVGGACAGTERARVLHEETLALAGNWAIS